jgi:hypothetical protein
MEQIMDLLEIVMLIIGILIIILSCRIVAHPNKDKYKNPYKDLYTHEELDSLKEQQNEMLSSASEETIAKTEDYLSKLSNEKIMAVSEYSEQVLEKINRNHEEVVFLYNMLNHKEKDLKETATVFDNSQLRVKELSSKDSEEAEPKVIVYPKQLGEQAQKIKALNVENSESDDSSVPLISFNNAEILKHYKDGRSVLDIAKELGIGQGEVKLIIDLYKDR